MTPDKNRPRPRTRPQFVRCTAREFHHKGTARRSRNQRRRGIKPAPIRCGKDLYPEHTEVGFWGTATAVTRERDPTIAVSRVAPSCTPLKFSLVELGLFLDCGCSHEGAGRRDA